MREFMISNLVALKHFLVLASRECLRRLRAGACVAFEHVLARLRVGSMRSCAWGVVKYLLYALAR
jgi:hypothetical protein